MRRQPPQAVTGQLQPLTPSRCNVGNGRSQGGAAKARGRRRGDGISIADVQGSATPASMKSRSNGRGQANRIVAIDPELSATVLRTGHKNRLKPPFKLRQPGRSPWRPRPPGSATTSVRSSPLPPPFDGPGPVPQAQRRYYNGLLFLNLEEYEGCRNFLQLAFGSALTPTLSA